MTESNSCLSLFLTTRSTQPHNRPKFSFRKLLSIFYMSSESIGSEAKLPEAAEPSVFSLNTILNDAGENLEHPDFKDKLEGGWDEKTSVGAAEGYCVECEGASSADLGRCIHRCGPTRPARTVALREL